jgi:hypothetical protein
MAAACLFATACRAPVANKPQPGVISNAEMSAKLANFATQAPTMAVLETFGHSVHGLPLEVLRIGDFSAPPTDPDRPLTFLLVGTQHGMEPSGGEAILQLAGELLAEELPGGHLLAPRDAVVGPSKARYILVPKLNPDGHDRNRRVNGNGVNLSTDFTLLTQPESQALVRLLDCWRPDVVLDLHESAVWKKQTLGAQGYLLDFEAQFETGNHPAIAPPIRDLCFGTLLPKTIAATAASGVPAQRYIGEITRLDQTLVHGGLSLRNLRNYAAMRGCVSFLVENRLDPSSGTYETPRNIRERVRKQHASLTAFLQTCLSHRGDIRTAVDAARRADVEPVADWPLPRSAEYVPIPGQETLTVSLRRIDDDQLENCVFTYCGGIRAGAPLPPTDAYRVTARSPQVAEWLLAQRLGFGFDSGRTWFSKAHGNQPPILELPKQDCPVVVPCGQPGGRLAALLLDPSSAAAIWNTPAFAPPPDEPPATRIDQFPANPE